MDYSVVDIPNDRYVLKGIKLKKGKTCCYWTNKNNSGVINTVVVILNNSNVIDIKNNETCISLDGVTNANDMIEMLNAFSQEISKLGSSIRNIKFKFVVSNKDEEIVVNQIISSFRVNAIIERSKGYSNDDININTGRAYQGSIDKKQEELKKQEDILKSQESRELNSSGMTDNITTYNNGVMNKVSITDGVAYYDNDTLSIAEKKKMLLEELMKDPVEYANLVKMSKEELDVYLTKMVTSNNKNYYLERPDSKEKFDARKNIANDVAYREDGLVNTELGIVANSPTNSNRYGSVEKQNDNNYNLVTPEVTTSSINSSGSSQVDASSRSGSESFSSDNVNDTNITYENLSEREEEEVYYFDDYNNLIYNSLGDVVGKVGNDGYEIDWETNNLKRNGEVIGAIGDINDMGKDNSKSNSKVRVYKKETNSSMYGNNNDTNDQAAFISLPVIMFIISLFLLIGSGIILFLMK